MSSAADSDRGFVLVVLGIAAIIFLAVLGGVVGGLAHASGACQATCAAAGHTVSEPAEGDTCRCWTPVVVTRLGAGDGEGEVRP